MLSIGCKANARVFLPKTGHGPQSYIRPEEGKWFARCNVVVVVVVVVVCNFGL